MPTLLFPGPSGNRRAQSSVSNAYISAVCTGRYSLRNDTVVLCRHTRALSARRSDNDILVPDSEIGPVGRPAVR